MNQTDKAKRFAELHVKGAPLLLYNAWDAGSAKSIFAAGAQAIATSSWSVAGAQGYRDGETIPIELAERIVGRIAATIEAPVTVDFEGGYSEDDGELADNISRLLDTGVIGINFEDRVVKGSGLYGVDRQARRIAAIRGIMAQTHQAMESST
jgi:2-methylisocitrate lyase-like PEP mutase family enzyme